VYEGHQVKVKVEEQEARCNSCSIEDGALNLGFMGFSAMADRMV